jgi:two-component system chemotaxis sensor kinase CheA
MADEYKNDPLLDMFIFETSQMLEQLEQVILISEKENFFSEEAINEIFRIMHTIKGSAAMMMFNNIAVVAHSIEDLFFYLREEKPEKVNFTMLVDYVLDNSDFIKSELSKIKNGNDSDGDSTQLIESSNKFLEKLKQTNQTGEIIKETKKKAMYETPQTYKQIKIEDNSVNAYKAVIYFEDNCEMENIRAYTVVRNLEKISSEIYYLPEDILDDDNSVDIIRSEGFTLYLKSDYSFENLQEYLMQTLFIRDLEFEQLENTDVFNQFYYKNKNKELQSTEEKVIEEEALKKDAQKVQAMNTDKKISGQKDKEGKGSAAKQNIISVNVTKLDKLMDLVGEMVTAEAMVIQNPDLIGLELDNFKKSARQLHKITCELQDIVMSIRMVSLAATFNKMHRIVRDMSKKLNKQVDLIIVGEDTEVDKNIIEHISDPLMHLVRNSVDHGIETSEERKLKGKSEIGSITLEAKGAGSDVLIIVKDDGSGLNKEKILKKARENQLFFKNENEMTDKEIYNLILLPGFSTNENVTEYSGRGVGMDVVARNIELVGGSLSVDSIAGQETTIVLKIPLTLAIIDGMNIKVGNAYYTIPIISITESFRPKEGDVFTDPDGNEMIMVRGQCYHILRLHEFFHINTNITDFKEGIIIMLEQDEKRICVFADELLGQQQVVVKSLPDYIKRYKKISGLAGCTLLGDGSISLIIDVGNMVN